MDFTTILLIIVALLFMLIAYLRRDGSLAIGLKSGAQTFVQLIPIFIAVFIIVGLSEVLVPQELVSRWLGAQSGWRGIVLASVLGAVMPPQHLCELSAGGHAVQSGGGHWRRRGLCHLLVTADAVPHAAGGEHRWAAPHPHPHGHWPDFSGGRRLCGRSIF